MLDKFGIACDKYLTELRNIHSNNYSTSELSFRPAFDSFLLEVKNEISHTIEIISEGKKLKQVDLTIQ